MTITGVMPGPGLAPPTGETGPLGPDFPMPQDQRFFEDYVTGARYSYGHLDVDEASVLAFARAFDPQRMHTDPAYAATEGPYGGVIASGWHTGSLYMCLYARHFLPTRAGLAAPGLDELRWTTPVRPGDRVWSRIEVGETRRSVSKPDRGVVHVQGELLNQDDVVVLSMRAVNLYLCREAG